MKKILTIVLCVLLGIGAIGGSFALAKHIDGKLSSEQPNDSSIETPDTSETPDESGEPNTAITWELCTDISQLQVGDQIIIASSSKECALSTLQNTSNRSAARIFFEDETLTIEEQVQIQHF